MSEERADLVGGFRREDVLELAGLLLDFGFAVHGEAVGEQALGQPVAANDAPGAAAASRRQCQRSALPSPTNIPSGRIASWQGFTKGL